MINKKTIKSKTITYDFARKMKGAIEVRIDVFAKAIVGNM